MSIRIKIGNVFKVRLPDGTIRYFQFIGKDLSELNGDVIAIFKTHFSDDCINEDEIANDEIECFMHTSVLAGIKLGLWERVFSLPIKIKESEIVFRFSLDSVLNPGLRCVSHKWVVWSMNNERKYVGTLPKNYYNADLGGVYAPIHVISRLETGEVPDKFYPTYK